GLGDIVGVEGLHAGLPSIGTARADAIVANLARRRAGRATRAWHARRDERDTLARPVPGPYTRPVSDNLMRNSAEPSPYLAPDDAGAPRRGRPPPPPPGSHGPAPAGGSPCASWSTRARCSPCSPSPSGAACG